MKLFHCVFCDFLVLIVVNQYQKGNDDEHYESCKYRTQGIQNCIV